jgi:diaminopimelate decarboxylase
MTQFERDGDELLIGEERLSRLAARVGQTPFYAYGRSLIRERVAHVRSALPRAVKLHYAMKANPMPALVALMAPLVDGIDVASAGELKVALDAGTAPDEISFAGPASATRNSVRPSLPECLSMSSQRERSHCSSVHHWSSGYPRASLSASTPTSSSRAQA